MCVDRAAEHQGVHEERLVHHPYLGLLGTVTWSFRIRSMPVDQRASNIQSTRVYGTLETGEWPVLEVYTPESMVRSTTMMLEFGVGAFM